LLSGHAYATVLLDRVVAVVNQDVITWSELYKAMEADALPAVKELGKEEKRKVLKENEALFLESLINLRVQLQEAGNMGVRVSDGEVQEAIGSIKKKYAMTDSAFLESLKNEGFTFEEYKKRLREQIIISKLVNMQIRNKLVINDEDINKFITENKEISENAESFRIRQILLKRQKDIDRSKVEEKADGLLDKIKQGESFSDLAKQYSEDPSAKTGGDLGLLKKSQLNNSFTDVISRMQPGEISEPFWSENGLHIIKLESRVEAKNKDEIREEAKNMLSNKIFTERYNAWIKSLREKSFIEIRL
jgi:peptidyl-prolyl cis-trans isomerase SurA